MNFRLHLPARIILAAGLLLVSGCANTFDATRLGVPVTMASGADAPAQGTSFKVTSHAVYGLLGRGPVLRTVAQEGLGQPAGRGIRRSRPQNQGPQQVFDMIITGLTLGIIVPRSVTFEGVVVQPK